MVLQVKKSGGALDVGKGFGAGDFLPLEHLSRTERPFEMAYELFEVVLHDAVKRDQVAVDVVQDFDRRWLGLHEVERGTAGKDFDVAFMWRKKRNKAVGQAAFATHPWDNWIGHFASLYCMDKQVLGSPGFVHRAGALAGLAGMICSSVARTDVDASELAASLCVLGVYYIAGLSTQRPIGLLTRQPGYPGTVISPRQLSRSFVSPLEQFGKHHCGAGGCFASLGSAGIAGAAG